MKKLFSMMLILGICTSFGALAHGPPGHTEKQQVQKEKNFIDQVVAMENVYMVETTATTESQALLAQHQLAEIALVEVKTVSVYRESRRSTAFSAAHYRTDRSRFRWCS